MAQQLLVHIAFTVTITFIHPIYEIKIFIVIFSTLPKDPVTGTKPNVALSPTQPDQQLGIRIDPP